MYVFDAAVVDCSVLGGLMSVIDSAVLSLVGCFGLLEWFHLFEFNGTSFPLRSTICLFLFALVSPIHFMAKQVGEDLGSLFLSDSLCLFKVDGLI